MNSPEKKLLERSKSILHCTFKCNISSIWKIIVIIVLGFTVNSVIAQEYQYIPFPDSNAVWSEVYWKTVFEPYPRWVYNKYALFNEDTVINGITYHKLFLTNATEITKENSECIGGIREDSLKKIIVTSNMFHYSPEIEEVVLFDFSLNVGDTINETRYGDSLPVNVSPTTMYVTDIDTILVHNTKRKVFSFNIPWTYWIEGIGSVQGLIFPSGDLPTNGISNDLVCMHQNDTLLFYNSGSWDVYYDGCVPSFVIDDVALISNTDVNVYPNPVTNGPVYFKNLNFDLIELFDLNGNMLLYERIKSQNTYELDIAELTTGIYTYRLRKKGLIPTMGKLIVE